MASASSVKRIGRGAARALAGRGLIAARGTTIDRRYVFVRDGASLGDFPQSLG